MTTEIEKMLEHILFLARQFRGCRPQYVAMVILFELGFDTKHIGYRFLLRVIVLYIQEPLQLSIKSLYIAAAAEFDGTVSAEQIEQAIRSAIRQAWNKRNDTVWSCIFRPDGGKLTRPTNLEFVSMVANVVELWRGCCEAYDEPIRTEEGIQ